MGSYCISSCSLLIFLLFFAAVRFSTETLIHNGKWSSVKFRCFHVGSVAIVF